ncbi:MAG TPA: hypothetical protein VG125_01255 [Pirellulales bacterium]|nr:hypothetical protein [Pirellulales bacterium]
MSQEESPNPSPLIPTQRGRKRWKIGGTMQPFSARPRLGPPRCDMRPPAARQPKGPYESAPESVVDRRPPVAQKPVTATALKLLELYYRMNAVVMATEERVPIEWIAERILGVRKARAYAIQREIAEHADLEAWFRRKVLDAMRRGRIGGGRQTKPSRLADAFFIALAGGEAEARNCARSVAEHAFGKPKAGCTDRDAADSEVRDYLVHSRLLWRLGENKD